MRLAGWVAQALCPLVGEWVSRPDRHGTGSSTLTLVISLHLHFICLSLPWHGFMLHRGLLLLLWKLHSLWSQRRRQQLRLVPPC